MLRPVTAGADVAAGAPPRLHWLQWAAMALQWAAIGCISAPPSQSADSPSDALRHRLRIGPTLGLKSAPFDHAVCGLHPKSRCIAPVRGGVGGAWSAGLRTSALSLYERMSSSRLHPDAHAHARTHKHTHARTYKHMHARMRAIVIVIIIIIIIIMYI
jgi:hypothetical protein